MIVTAIPYAADKNLGAAYNEFMSRLTDDEWACFIDHDAMFTTADWYRQLSSAVKLADPEMALLTGVANRTGARWQAASGVDRSNHDIRYHRKIGSGLLNKHGSSIVDVTDRFPLGGYLMCLSKCAWSRAGEFVDGMFCVDHLMHLGVRSAGLRVGLLPGLYLYHWRRAGGHSAPDPALCASCPCRTMENS